MASNVKKKCKLIKIWGEGICTVFEFKEHPVVSKLKQDSCHDVHARLPGIYKVFHSHIISIFFYLSPNQSNVKFCHKNFPLPIVSHDHWTRDQKCVTDEI